MFGFGERKQEVAEVPTEYVGELVNNSNGTIHTTSQIIAEAFGKRIDIIHRNIAEMPESFLHNFAEVTETTPAGRTSKYYNISRDGMSMLVMGFTGSKAMSFKIKFIEAFNLMEKKLLEEPKFIVPTNMMEAMQLAMEQMEVADKLQEKVDILYAPETAKLYTTNEIAKALGTTAIRFNKQLMWDDILYRGITTNGAKLPKVKYEKYVVVNNFHHSYGVEYSIKWNEDGREFLLKKYMDKDWTQ